jgi:hypothetical protein
MIDHVSEIMRDFFFTIKGSVVDLFITFALKMACLPRSSYSPGAFYCLE